MFQADAPEHRDFLDPAMSKLFFQILQTGEDADVSLQLPANTRDELLEMILTYYRLHVPGFREMQSHHVLHTVMG